MSVLSALSRWEQHSAWWGRGVLHFALLTIFTQGQHLCVHARATSPALDTDRVAVGDSCENGKVYHDNGKVYHDNVNFIMLCSLGQRGRDCEICQSDSDDKV